MLKSLIPLALLTTLLGGCGLATPVAPLPVAAGTTPVQAHDLYFRPVTIQDLVTMPYDDPKAIGTLISFEGSFARDRWSYSYGTTTEGYRLWDRAGHSIRCFNIYSERDFSGSHPARDLSAAASWLLNYGTFVKLEGAYHPGYNSSSHGGSFRVEPSIDLYFINGRPVKEFVAK